MPFHNSPLCPTPLFWLFLASRPLCLGGEIPPPHPFCGLAPDSPPWMIFLMNRKKAALIYMRIDLSGRNVGVPQQLLNDSQIGSVRKQMGRERVPQQMRINVDFCAG